MKRKDIFYNTKKKVTLISTAIVFLCLFTFAIITKTTYTKRVFKNIDNQLLDLKKMADKSLTNKGNDYGILFGEMKGLKPPPIPPNFTVIIYREQELNSISPNAYFNRDTLPTFPKNSNDKVVKIESNGYEFRGINFDHNGVSVQFIINIDSELESIHQLMNSIIISLFFLVILALILSYFLSWRVIKPVKEAYDKQAFFVQDASHEIRTPIAVIKGKLELLANSWEDTIETHFEHISKMMSEVTNLEKLSGDLLLLSKEDIDSSINVTEFNLSDFIDDISEFYSDLAEIGEKNFIVNKPNKSIIVQWDYNKIKRMIIILLENAFKYTNINGDITLSFHDIGKNIKITVMDNGIGIKEADKNRIFDRFFRSADVRVKNISGSGIGLSLFKSISNTLGIKIKLSSEHSIGTVFTMSVPKIIK